MNNAWKEYDSAADRVAIRHINGLPLNRPWGDVILPTGLSTACEALIQEDPEAFIVRVRACAYARAMRNANE